MINFKKFDIDTAGRTAGKIKTYCPRCRDTRRNKRDKSLSVNIDTGLFKCHHCQFTGRAGGAEGEVTRPSPYTGSNTSVSAWKPRSGTLPPLTGELAAWLTGIRHIPVDVAIRMGVSAGQHYFSQSASTKPCICFNYLMDGQVITTKYRSLQKEFAMQTGAPVIPYNIDGILGTPQCIITEGEMDALSFAATNRTDVISVPTGAHASLDWLEPYIHTHLADKDVIYLAVDNDEPGRHLCHTLRHRLGEARCRTVTYAPGCKDANEQLIKHGPESLLQILADAPLPPLKGVLDITCIEDDIDVVFANGMGSGADTGWENLDRYCTFERGRLAIITGVPGSGKSEFVDELMVRLNLRHEWRGAFFSPENMPLSYHIVKLIEKLGGCKFKEGVMPPHIYRTCLEHIKQNFSFILPPTGYTLDAILDQAAQLAVRHGLAMLSIDPWNCIDHHVPPRQTETQYINSTLERLRTFALRHNCLVILTAHPRKMNREPGTNRIPVPTLYDINGSAGFYNKADYGLTVERDYNARVTRIHIKKVRFRNLGYNGEANFVYGLAGGRFHPCDETKPQETVFDETCWLDNTLNETPHETDL